MIHSNIVYSFPCSQLSFEQRALTRQADNDWNKLQKLLFGSYINFTYPYKKHQGYVLDHLIVGSNPILNYFLLQKLFNHFKTQKVINPSLPPFRIGLLIPDNKDYWGYQFMKNKDFWLRLNKAYHKTEDVSKFSLTKDSVNDFNNFFNDENIAQLFLLNNQHYDPGFVFQNKFSPEFVIQLIDKKEKYDFHWFHQDKLGVLLNQQKRISDNFTNDFLSKFSKFSQISPSLKILEYPLEKQSSSSEHNSTPMHFLLTNFIWSTSYPYDWFNLKKYEIKTSDFASSFSNNLYEYTHLTHDFSLSAFGSSKHTCNKFLGLEEQAIYDIIDILNCDISNVITSIIEEKKNKFKNPNYD